MEIKLIKHTENNRKMSSFPLDKQKFLNWETQNKRLIKLHFIKI